MDEASKFNTSDDGFCVARMRMTMAECLIDLINHAALFHLSKGHLQARMKVIIDNLTPLDQRLLPGAHKKLRSLAMRSETIARFDVLASQGWRHFISSDPQLPTIQEVWIKNSSVIRFSVEKGLECLAPPALRAWQESESSGEQAFDKGTAILRKLIDTHCPELSAYVPSSNEAGELPDDEEHTADIELIDAFVALNWDAVRSLLVEVYPPVASFAPAVEKEAA